MYRRMAALFYSRDEEIKKFFESDRQYFRGLEAERRDHYTVRHYLFSVAKKADEHARFLWAVVLV